MSDISVQTDRLLYCQNWNQGLVAGLVADFFCGWLAQLKKEPQASWGFQGWLLGVGPVEAATVGIEVG